MKFIKILFAFFLFLTLTVATGIYTLVPALPEDTDVVIDEVLASPIPEVVSGKSGFATSGDVQIWYETRTPAAAPKGTVLLIMGLSADCFAWPEDLIVKLVDAGYQVIRFDNRGTGMSDWLSYWTADYTLSDMAADAVAVLNANQVEKAHLIGASMGGMIAQEFALMNPERTQSLISVMSSAHIYDEELPVLSKYVILQMVLTNIRYGTIQTERNLVKMQLGLRTVIMGDAYHKLNVKTTAEKVIYNIRERKSFNRFAALHQSDAITASGSRIDLLKKLEIPTLVIHGDKDPLIPFEHGRKTAEIIPNAETLWVADMGHDLPDVFLDTITNRIVSHVSKTEGKFTAN